MKIQPGAAKQKKDRSLAILHGEAASSAVENAGCAYQSPSVIATGADAQGVALLSTMTNLVLSVLLIKVPSLVEGKQSLMKRTTIIIATASALTWLPIVFVMLLFRAVNPLLLTALWIVSLVPTTLLFPLRDNWLASLVPAEKMGHYLSWRSVIAGVCYLGTFYLMGYVLNRSVIRGVPESATVAGNPVLARSYAFVLAVAFLASASSVVLYFWVRPPAMPKTVETKSSLSFVAFLKNARKSHLGTFIFFVSVYTFAVNLAGPLFASYMLQDLKFSMMTFTAIVSCEYIARIISLTFWGRMVDKVGSLKVLNNVTYFIPFIPVMWLFSSHFAYLCGVQMLSGTVWAAFDLSVQTFIYKATPPDQRLRYIVYHRSLTSFSAAIGTLTGAFLLNYMFRIFGSQILALFLVSGVLRMVVARIMLPRLTTKGIPDAAIHPELALELAAVLPNSRSGLYYHPEVWRRFTQRAAIMSGEILGRAMAKVDPSRNGLFYKPWRWAEYLPGRGAQPVPAEVSVRPSRNSLFYKTSEWNEYLAENGIRPADEEAASTSSARYGLLHHPEAWAHFQPQAVQGQIARGAAQDAEKNVSKNGLFHNPQKWGEYLKQSLVMDAATMRTGSEGLVLRPPVFYHPEMWENYKKETATARIRSARKAPVKDALLYHPEDWKKYEQTAARRDKKHSRIDVRVVAAGKFRAGDPVPLKKALLYHPEEWEKFERATARKSKKASVPAGARLVAPARAREYGKTHQAAITPRTNPPSPARRLKTAAAPA
jgi:hypothetical protein